MKRTLHLFLCTLFLFVFAYGVEVPSGLLPYDIGDVLIGEQSDSGVSTFNIVPPGTDDFGYLVVNEMGYSSGGAGSNATNSSASVSLNSDGYFVFPSGLSYNTYYAPLTFALLSSDNNISITYNTPCWIWIDMFFLNSSGAPVSTAVIESTTFAVSDTPLSPNSQNFVSLASTDYLVYDESTGHLHGYVDFPDGIGTSSSSSVSGFPCYYRFQNSTYNLKSYSYQISNIVFGKDKSLFTPPGAGSADPDEPPEPTFEEQVLQDLDNIQANQQTTNQVIQDSVSGAVSDIDSKYEAAVNPDLTDSMAQAKDGFEQIEQFEESLFEDMAQYESDVNPAQLVFDGSIINALSFVSHLWVDCFDQLGIWQPIITFPMFFGLALLVIGRGYQAQVSTRIRVQRRAYLNDLNAANARRAAQMERMGK